MPHYRFKAMTSAGKPIRGVIEASNSASALKQLRSQGHYPVSAVDTSQGDWRHALLERLTRSRTASGKEIAASARELSLLLKAGLSLDRALRTMLGLKAMTSLRPALEQALTALRDGSGLADALASTGVFPKLYVSMVRTSELTGDLDETLQKLADYLDRQQSLRDRVVSALIYPAMLLVTAIASISIILVYVLPTFQPFFESSGHSPPAAVQAMLTAGAILGGYGWALGIGGLIAFVWGRRWLKHPGNRMRMDQRLLRLAVAGKLLTTIESERLARTLGTLIQHGVALSAALTVTADGIGNRVIAQAVAETARRLREGSSLASQLNQTGLFPDLLTDLVRVGEESGRLDDMLLRAADMMEYAVRQDIDRILVLLVPGLTISLGVIVAGIIATLMTAILSVNDLAFQ